jgi:hypothetical protein
MKFVPSLELSRMLYEEHVRPIMELGFPDVPYAAATLGMCSEVLGLDDEISMDHEWGPRLSLFLSKEDQARYGEELAHGFRQQLPKTFKGLDMMWRKPGVDIHDTRAAALYHVGTTTVDRALGFCGGLDALPLQDVDWLKISEQHLLEFTSGTVYHDGPGELTQAREALAYYPDDVLRFLLMCGWNSVGGEVFPIGRIGSRGDALGLHIQAGKAAQHLMRLGFMVSKQYYTYRKWFGTLFKRLPIAAELEPVLMKLLREEDWRQVEQHIWDAAGIILRYQNALSIAPQIPVEVGKANNGRSYLPVDYWKIGRRTAGRIPPRIKALQDNELWWLHEKQLILWNGEVGKWLLFLQK